MHEPKVTSMDNAKDGLEISVGEIIKLGQSWGMADSDIQDCLYTAAAGETFTKSVNNMVMSGRSAQKLEHRTLPSLVAHAVRVLTNVAKTLLIVIVMSCVLLAVLYSAILLGCALSPELENKIGKVAAPWIFPTMRIARMTLKPVADKFDISSKCTLMCFCKAFSMCYYCDATV